MSAHDWRDGIGHFCVADYLAELDDMHLCKALYISPGFTVVICLEHLGAPDVIDFGFRAQTRRSTYCRNNTREPRSLMLDLLVALPLRSRSKPLTVTESLCLHIHKIRVASDNKR